MVEHRVLASYFKNEPLGIKVPKLARNCFSVAARKDLNLLPQEMQGVGCVINSRQIAKPVNNMQTRLHIGKEYRPEDFNRIW